MKLPLWLYWEGAYPLWIRLCHKTIREHAADVRVITPEVFDQLWDTDRDIPLDQLCVAHRADFIRSFLIARYGGMWLDSDTLLMRPIQPVFDMLDQYDFAGYRDRSKYISNSFMAARPGSFIAGAYYQKLCDIMRSGQPIEWLTLGAHALTPVVEQSGVPWYELPVEMIQPICWSQPRTFFTQRTEPEHDSVFQTDPYCYMLSGNMIRGIEESGSGENLLHEHSFFSYLLRRSLGNSELQRRHGGHNPGKATISHRRDTDDDIWVIPEVIEQDMYRIKDILAGIRASGPAYVIDCGAHIGSFSIMCASFLHDTEVIALEPNPDSFEFLRQNAEHFGSIRALNKAIGDGEDHLQLYAPDQIDWNGRWTSIPNANASIRVETVNLADLIREADRPIFMLKLDLEGFEDEIIRKISAEELKKIQVIVLETHTDQFDHEKLRRCGFELVFQPIISTARQFVYAQPVQPH